MTAFRSTAIHDALAFLLLTDALQTFLHYGSHENLSQKSRYFETHFHEQLHITLAISRS